MRYAKLINQHRIIFPPTSTETVSNYHLAVDKLKADGYKPFDEGLPMPADGQNYRACYIEVEHMIVRNWEVIPAPEKSYIEQRAAEYPPVTEYLDAQVKINSGDEALIAAGNEQLNAYYEACLAVKAKYPKPEEQKVEYLEKV